MRSFYLCASAKPWTEFWFEHAHEGLIDVQMQSCLIGDRILHLVTVRHDLKDIGSVVPKSAVRLSHADVAVLPYSMRLLPNEPDGYAITMWRYQSVIRRTVQER